jgi:hypothetical protein
MDRELDDWSAAWPSDTTPDIAGVLTIESYPEIATDAPPHSSGLMVTGVFSREAMGYPLCVRIIPGEPMTLKMSYAFPTYTAAQARQIGSQLLTLLQEYTLSRT